MSNVTSSPVVQEKYPEQLLMVMLWDYINKQTDLFVAYVDTVHHGQYIIEYTNGVYDCLWNGTPMESVRDICGSILAGSTITVIHNDESKTTTSIDDICSTNVLNRLSFTTSIDGKVVKWEDGKWHNL